MLTVKQLVDTLKMLGASKPKTRLKAIIEEKCLDQKSGLVMDAPLFGLVITPDKPLAEKCKKLNIYDLIGLESYYAYVDGAKAYQMFSAPSRARRR